MFFRALAWAIVRSLFRAAVLISPPGVLYELSRLRGWIYDRLVPIPADVRSNVESTLGSGSETERIIRELNRFWRAYRFIYHLQRFDGFRDPVRWPIEGRERLDAALRLNRGVLLVSAHVGYAQAVGPILRCHGYPVTQVTAKKYFESLRADRSRWAGADNGSARPDRERSRGMDEARVPDYVPASLDVRPIFDALERNRIVLIAADSQLGIDFVELPLLGRPLLLATGFARIAMHARCPALPVFAVKGDRRHPVVVEIGEPLPIDPEASVSENVAFYVERLDAVLRQVPHLWQKWWRPEFFANRGSMPEAHYSDPYDWSGRPA